MGYDTFARETYCVGDYASEAEARAELERQRGHHRGFPKSYAKENPFIIKILRKRAFAQYFAGV